VTLSAGASSAAGGTQRRLQQLDRRRQPQSPIAQFRRSVNGTREAG